MKNLNIMGLKRVLEGKKGGKTVERENQHKNTPVLVTLLLIVRIRCGRVVEDALWLD